MKSKACASPRGVRKEMKLASKLRFKGLAKGDEGYILIMSLFVLLILSLIGLGLAVVSINEFNLSARTKLMDEAYSNADAGVNRMTIEIQAHPEYTSGTPAADNIYLTGTTAQAHVGPETFPTGTLNSNYDVYLWQSDASPTNPTSKVIVSTGKITRGGKTAERTIETRIIAGSGGKDYDASFDYLIYNGMDSNGDGVSDGGTWAPSDLHYFGTIPSGSFVWDGATPYNGHSPKGSIYTRGSIRVPTSLFADAKFRGNMVALDDITLSNSWELHFAAAGIVVEAGNVIAGLDGSGSANLSTTAIGGTQTAMEVLASGGAGGNVDAGTDVNIRSDETISFGRPCKVDGIRAGRDVNIKGTVNISQAMSIGVANGIISGRTTSIDSRWLTGVNTGSIKTGPRAVDWNDGIGVKLHSVAASSISTGAITCTGQVDTDSDVSSITTGNIAAGNELNGSAGGTGIYTFIHNIGASVTHGDITSLGKVLCFSDTDNAWWNVAINLTTGGITTPQDIDCHFYAKFAQLPPAGAGSMNIGQGKNLVSGGNVKIVDRQDIPGLSDNVYTGNVSAVGNISIQGNDEIWTGNLSANGNIGVTESLAFWGSSASFHLGSIYSGANDTTGYVREYLGGCGDINGGGQSLANAGPGYPAPPQWAGNGYPGNALLTGPHYNQQEYFNTGCNVYILNNAQVDDLSGNNDTISAGNVYSKGNVWIYGHDKINITGNVIASVQNNPSCFSMRVESRAKDVTIGNRLTVNGTLYSQGGIYTHCYGLNGGDDTNLYGGIWSGQNVETHREEGLPDATDTDMYIGKVPTTNDSVRARAGIYIEALGDTCAYVACYAADVYFWDYGAGNPTGKLTNPAGNANSNRDDKIGGCPNDGDFMHFKAGGNPDGRRDFRNASDPGLPGTYGGPGVASPNVTRPAEPTVGHNSPAYNVDLLNEAGLDAPVNILSPNWAYFENAAETDDIANGPSTKHCPHCGIKVDATSGPPYVFPAVCPNCGTSLGATPAGPAHVVYDGGAGDADHAVNGYISLVWDATMPYSTNETVYSPDPSKDIRIQSLNWSLQSASFQGTIVSRKNLNLTNNTTSWVVSTGQAINCVAGVDILANTSGFALVTASNSQFHFWSGHDIVLDNQKIVLASVNAFYGSFTACDKVTYNSNSIFEATTFRWSRWALDPVAWVPPFQVLNWREIY